MTDILTVLLIISICVGFVMTYILRDTKKSGSESTEAPKVNPKKIHRICDEEIEALFNEDLYLKDLKVVGLSYIKVTKDKVTIIRKNFRNEDNDIYIYESPLKYSLDNIVENIKTQRYILNSKEEYDRFYDEWKSSIYIGDRVKIKIPYPFVKDGTFILESWTKEFYVNNTVWYEDLSEGKVVNIIDKDTFPTIIVKFDNWPDNIGMKYSFLEKIIE